MRARGGRLRVLVSDDVGLQNKRQRRLALNILPLASRLLARRRQPRDRLAASVAATLAPTHPALGRLECAFRPAVPPGGATRRYHPGVPPWMEDARAIGVRGEGFQPHGDPRFLLSRRERLAHLRRRYKRTTHRPHE